ncbi:questin oxidase family protein [Streptomyces phytophilus]|uniref:questin oxidase family protein n=1 Tax=Streptomyces phytophilus TaxID=722715 RepID=UPI0015F106BF|nr:questin oxidase family protein [Streptomyces phytophilus]
MEYYEAVSDAFDRLEGLGYEWGSASFVNHAPMAAEAMARLGHGDHLPEWITRILRRPYHDAPVRTGEIGPDDDDRARALGDFSRVADWAALFERELAADPWREVLARWWPRLLPGLSVALTHGVIRTSHAMRAMAQAEGRGDDRRQRRELAQGLGYWAARYEHRPLPAAGRPEEGEALGALDRLVLDGADFYARARPAFAIPLIHAVTAPAAVRLACEYLPAEQHAPSYRVARAATASIRGFFTGRPHRDPLAGIGQVPPLGEIAARSIELGDEHAIKLAEVAIRHDAAAPDARFAAAAHVANRLIARHHV